MSNLSGAFAKSQSATTTRKLAGDSHMDATLLTLKMEQQGITFDANTAHHHMVGI
jgi:hypothetical protein